MDAKNLVLMELKILKILVITNPSSMLCLCTRKNDATVYPQFHLLPVFSFAEQVDTLYVVICELTVTRI